MNLRLLQISDSALLRASLAVRSIPAASSLMGEQLLALAATWEWSAPGIAVLGEPCATWLATRRSS
jgi:hypothetical protein